MLKLPDIPHKPKAVSVADFNALNKGCEVSEESLLAYDISLKRRVPVLLTPFALLVDKCRFSSELRYLRERRIAESEKEAYEFMIKKVATEVGESVNDVEACYFLQKGHLNCCYALEEWVGNYYKYLKNKRSSTPIAPMNSEDITKAYWGLGCYYEGVSLFGEQFWWLSEAEELAEHKAMVGESAAVVSHFTRTGKKIYSVIQAPLALLLELKDSEFVEVKRIKEGGIERYSRIKHK